MNIPAAPLKPWLFVSAWIACAVASQAADLRPIQIEQFCITPDQPAVLRWRFEGAAPEMAVEAAIRDYAERPVSSHAVKVSAEGLVELPVELAAGYYEIDFPAQRQRFGVVSLPAYQGPRDPFFAIDSAMSWLVHSDETREGLVKVLRRCGILMSRERLNWAQINPAKGAWEWESPAHYETLRQTCRREGVEVLEMFHGTTTWAGQVGKYPEDLAGAARAWREIARRFSPTWGAMEVWNEPDISFGDFLPADQYLPLVKMFACTFQSGGVETPLVGGVFAHFNRQYLDNAARNGLLDHLSVVSFHTYGRAAGMEELISRHRQWLGDYGKPSMPLWITECGRPWKRGPQRPPAGEDADSALDIVMKGIEAKACGIARYFAFVYPYYEERESNFGMMGREATPLRSMAAYAQFVKILAHMDYLGDLACDVPGVATARVFGNQRETIAVLYTGKPAAGAEIQLGLPAEGIEGIDGRALAQTGEGAAPVPDGLVYVRLDRGKLGDRLKTDTAAMRLWSLGARPGPRPAAASPLVLRYQFDPAAVKAASEGYRVAAEPPGKMSLTFRAFNLSAEPQRRSLRLAFSRPVRIVGEAVESVTIPASGAADVRWEVDLAGAFAAGGTLRATVRSEGQPAASSEMVEIDLAGNPAPK